MRNITRGMRLLLTVAAGLFFSAAAALAAPSGEAYAAMENNAYTQPFHAPYYEGRAASRVTSGASYSPGWHMEGGRWFYTISGNTYYADGWQPINGKWYYFDKSGYCVTGWIRTTPDVRWGSNAWLMYYDPVNAWMVTGYQKIDGIGRYFDGQGYLLARLGYQFQVNGETYITDAAGICSRPYQSEGAPFVNASDVFETLAPDDVVSGDYEFQAKVNENTVVEPFGFDSSLFAGAEYADHIYWCNLPDDSLKGQIGAWYRNVGTFAGRSVDVKFTITDYELLTLYGLEYGTVGFDTQAIGIAEDGVRYAECSIAFYDHETGEPVTVKGYATITDIDFSQTCVITSDYDKIFVADDCGLLYTQNNNGNPVFADGAYEMTSREDEDSSGQVLVNFTSDSFSYGLYNNLTFWNNDLGLPFYYGMSGGRYPHFTERDVRNDPDLGKYSWLGYTATRFARVTTPYPPVKTVSDSDETDAQENTLDMREEIFTYKISENVPLQSDRKFYYTDYSISDTLASCLRYIDAKVVDDGGNDVTELFSITGTGNRIAFTCRDPGQDSFYGKNYHYIIRVEIDAGADLSSYLQDGVCVIPNTAVLSVKSAYEDESYETNEVITRLKIPAGTGDISVTKISSRDSRPLTDAEFTVYEWDGSGYAEYGKMQNNGDGTYSLSGLTYTQENGGWFKAAETKCPEGFEGKWEQEFQVAQEGGEGQKFSYTVKNDPLAPKAEIEVTKKDKVTGELLPGAEFAVYEWSRKEGGYGKTPALILSFDEAAGTYYNEETVERTEDNEGWFKIVETKIPDGYTGAWEQEFCILEADGGVQKFSYTAENVRLLDLTINKTIYAEDFYSFHGSAVFLFEVRGTDVTGSERSYARAVSFTEDEVELLTADDGTATLQTVIRGIPSGTYTVEEKRVSRYVLTDVTAQTENVSVALSPAETAYGGITPVRAEVYADMTVEDAEVTFVNRKITWDRFSHTDLKTNSFTLAAEETGR